MFEPIALLTALVCAAICVRIVSFRRAGSRYRPGVSVLAYLLAACSGCEALAVLLNVHAAQSPFVLAILALLLIQACLVRGNVAEILGSKREGKES